MIQEVSNMFGCDPEFFFTVDGEVVGAERVLKDGSVPGIVLDGVQVELNPDHNSCRAIVGRRIRDSFSGLKGYLSSERNMLPGAVPCFSSLVDIREAELASLSPASRRFGCAPSKNIYDGGGLVNVDAARYFKRAAGGHIHLGLYSPVFNSSEMAAWNHLPQVDERQRLVPLLDVIVGNTCVLIDQDAGQVERRKYYGRAGEYRLPKHGLEYRTLSNFWLRSFNLASFCMGMSRVATSILSETLTPGGRNLEQELLEQINFPVMLKAINQNDYDLVAENWVVVREFILKYHDSLGGSGVNRWTLNRFDKFLDVVHEKGIQRVFPEDPITSWTALPEDLEGFGWERFLVNFKPGQVS